jgi:four helix bundle protein
METSFRNLKAWQKSMALAETVYRLTRELPRQEEYRMSGQMIRAATSVPANLAEGYMRGTRKDYANFVSIARGSLAELETFLVLAERLGLAPTESTAAAIAQADEVARMLTGLRRGLLASKPSTLDPRP